MVNRKNVLLMLMNLFALPYITTAGAVTNPTGSPIGGGESYERWVLPSDATYVVASEAELLDRLKNAQWGDVIYVKDDAVIDLTGEWNIVVHPGVTLASGRGRNGSMGAHILTTARAHEPLFKIAGSFVRVTGLRLQGPTVKADFDGECETNEATGISAIRKGSADPFSNIEIDNNELWAWPHQAVNVTGTRGAHIHHNHIHHNIRYENDAGCETYGHGLGYGVTASLGDALIEANLFDHNRHDIASTGHPFSSYEARYNLVVEGGTDHSFDVHGCQDNPIHRNCRSTAYPYIAGDSIRIYGNTFWDGDNDAIAIRGLPHTGGEIYNNEFRQTVLFTGPSVTDEDAAIFQKYTLGNLIYWGNEMAVTVLPGWFISHGGADFWKLRVTSNYDPNELALGDFDGDGKQDVLRATGLSWFVSRQARQSWVKWNTSAITIDKLASGDFNGDNRTDVFRADGVAWYVSWSGQSGWSKLQNSSVRLPELRFGDFDGDGKTDVWRTNGSRWYVSWSGKSDWSPLAFSSIPLSRLRFGDFNGDGKTDVFRTDRRNWYVSWSAQSRWTKLNRSSIALAAFRFCDFNGDGVTDVARDSAHSWKVSYGAQTYWQDLRVFRSGSGEPADEFVSITQAALADYNGDGKCDVLAQRRF